MDERASSSTMSGQGMDVLLYVRDLVSIVHVWN